MAGNPYQKMPIARNQVEMQGYNVNGSVLQTVMGAAGASSVITFTDNSTVVEIAAIGSQGGYAAMRWIASTNTNPSVIATAGTANFDHIIPAGTVQKFAIPFDPTIGGVASIVGLNKQAGLFNRMAITGPATASIMSTEF